jgi:predicted RNA binding protein YcfA (HicA-like mRNA interferase family)
MPDDPQIACIEYFHPSGGHAARGNLATVLFRCAPEYKKFLRRINDEAVDFSAKLAQFFKDQVQALPAPLSETQRQKIASDIQVIYWEKTLFLRRMVMLSEDILAIVEGMTGLDQYIPWELTDIIAPDKLYALLGSPSVEAVEIPSKEEVVFENNEHTLDLLLEAFPPHDEPAELDLNQLAVEDFVQPEMSPGANRGEEKQAALRDIAAIILTKKAVDDEKEEPIKKIMGPNAVMSRASSAVRPQSVGQKKPERPSYSIASPAILKMTKTRHILTALRECGFTQIRSTGPHLVLTDDFGRNVVVPKRRVQKVGTVYGIYAQATALIRKLK